MEREPRTRQVQAKLELRQMEVEIRALRREQQFYRRLGFDQELMETQILDLQARQREQQRRIALADQRLNRRGEARLRWASRLLMAPYIALYGLQSVVGGLSRLLSDPA